MLDTYLTFQRLRIDNLISNIPLSKNLEEIQLKTK